MARRQSKLIGCMRAKLEGSSRAEPTWERLGKVREAGPKHTRRPSMRVRVAYEYSHRVSTRVFTATLSPPVCSLVCSLLPEKDLARIQACV